MSLHTLPTELVHQIIDYNYPADFEEFALSCRNVYQAAAASFSCYNAHRRILRYFAYSNSDEYRTDLQLLLAIFKDPVKGRCVRSADLRNGSWKGQSYWDHIQGVQPTEVLALLREFVETKAKEIWSDELRHTLRLDMDSYERSVQRSAPPRYWELWNVFYMLPSIMLLLLMPNVEEIRLPTEWMKLARIVYGNVGTVVDQNLWDVLNVFARDVRQLPSDGGILPRRLKRVVAMSSSPLSEPRARVCLLSVSHILGIPSVEEFYASNLQIDGVSDACSVGVMENIRLVELAACSIQPAAMAALLENLPALKVLRYSHWSSSRELETDWAPGELVAAIGRKAGKRLEELALSLDQVEGRLIGDVKSMRKFTALKKLEMDVGMFGYPTEYHDTHITVRKWTQTTIPCLGDILPTNVREVDLYVFDDNRCLIDEFDRDEVKMTSALGALGSLFSPNPSSFGGSGRKTIGNAERVTVRYSPSKVPRKMYHGNSDPTEELLNLLREIIHRAGAQLILVDPAEWPRALWKEEHHRRFGEWKVHKAEGWRIMDGTLPFRSCACKGRNHGKANVNET